MSLRMSNEEISRIISLFADLRGVNAEDIIARNRKSKVCMTRSMIYEYLHHVKNISSYEIARFFGRNRRNILLCIQTFKGWITYDTKLREEYNSLVEKIEELL